jgi:hypothetical protein
MKRTHLLALALLLSGTIGTAHAGDVGDRVDHRLDRKGDRVEQRLDDRGDRIEHRYDRGARWAGQQGHARVAHHLERWDRRGDRFDRRWDRRH